MIKVSKNLTHGLKQQNKKNMSMMLITNLTELNKDRKQRIVNFRLIFFKSESKMLVNEI